METIMRAVPPGILLVDDDVVTIRALSKALQGLGSIHFAKGGIEAIRLARSESIDLILLDAEMPVMNGFEVCGALKADPSLAHIPVIFVTSHAGQDVEEAGMAIGAVDFIAKPIRPAIVAARVASQLRLKHASDGLRELALCDSVTGLPNRRAFEDALAREWGRGRRSSESLSLLMVGIDDLRGYNADRGRRRGDEYLLGLTRALGLSLKRPADMACRYSGSTFAVMLPCTNRGGANEVVQRILKTSSHLELLHGVPAGLPLAAVSVGYSSFDELCDNWVSDGRQTRESAPPVVCAADLVEAANLALNEARRSDTDVERYVSVYRAMLERISDQPLQ